MHTNAVPTNVHKYTEINYKQFKYTRMSVNIFYVFEYCKYYETYKPYKRPKGKDYILLHIYINEVDLNLPGRKGLED